MPQGQIRKGFFFYFGLFVLLLIAVFLICLVIMLFNPGQTVLWMQYFTGNDHILITKTTDEFETPIDLNTTPISNIEINCSYAKVTVQKNSQYPDEGIHIINNAKGFTGAANAVHFDYKVYFEGSTLKIDITEPTGFLYFSTDVQVVLSGHDEKPLNFDNVNLKVNTTEGDVEIGGTTMKKAMDVKLASLDVKTQKGDIYLTEMFDTSTLTAMSLETDEGTIKATKEFTKGTGDDAKVEGINAPCDVVIATNKGQFDLGGISANNLSIRSKKGMFSIYKIWATATEVSCAQGNYKFDNVYGNLSFSNSEDSLLAPNINIGYLDGDFILSTRVEGVDSEPKITIREITGNIDVLAERGSFKVEKAHGAIAMTNKGHLTVDIVVADGRTANENILITNGDGSVRLGFLKDVVGNVTVETTGGDVNFDITQIAKFTATMVQNNTNQDALANDKIIISHGLNAGQTRNPLTISGISSTSGVVNVKTNASVYYNLVAVQP